MTNFRKSSIFLIIVLMWSSITTAQEISNTELKDFQIVIDQFNVDSNKINLICNEGCAWKTLSFSLSELNIIQKVDEYGMVNSDEESKKSDNNELSEFLFTIRKTDNGVYLQGLEGTAWKDLSFNINKNRSQAVDQYGMTD